MHRDHDALHAPWPSNTTQPADASSPSKILNHPLHTLAISLRGGAQLALHPRDRRREAERSPFPPPLAPRPRSPSPDRRCRHLPRPCLRCRSRGSSSPLFLMTPPHRPSPTLSAVGTTLRPECPLITEEHHECQSFISSGAADSLIHPTPRPMACCPPPPSASIHFGFGRG